METFCWIKQWITIGSFVFFWQYSTRCLLWRTKWSGSKNSDGNWLGLFMSVISNSNEPGYTSTCDFWSLHSLHSNYFKFANIWVSQVYPHPNHSLNITGCSSVIDGYQYQSKKFSKSETSFNLTIMSLHSLYIVHFTHHVSVLTNLLIRTDNLGIGLKEPRYYNLHEHKHILLFDQ